jgi:hypothetical protein
VIVQTKSSTQASKSPTDALSFPGTPHINQRYFDDKLSRGGPGGLVEDYNGVWGYVNTDDRRGVSLNISTNILRWEYRPGSALFVVWQQARQVSVTDGAFRFDHDFHEMFGTPGRNVFLVKIAYWLNY